MQKNIAIQKTISGKLLELSSKRNFIELQEGHSEVSDLFIQQRHDAMITKGRVDYIIAGAFYDR